jgi:hypothetical protein
MYDPAVRTTLSIDDDVLAAARHIASRERRTIGDVVTDLARQSLTRSEKRTKIRNGIVLLPAGRGGKPVTLEMVNELRDEGA